MNISCVSTKISWDPDDEVGKDQRKYFENNSDKIWANLRIRPGSSTSDLHYFKELDWYEDSLEITTETLLESFQSNNDNPFLNKKSALFEYRITTDIDLGQKVEDTPDLYVNELIQHLCFAVHEWPYGETRTEGFEYDNENGFYIVPFEIIKFMGDTYDVYNG